MKKLIIEVPDYLHRALKNRCFSQERTIKDYVIELLIEDLKLKKRTNAES